MNNMTEFAHHLPRPRCCPTCGQNVGGGPLMIDFGAGTVTHGKRAMKAPRRELLLAAALNDAHPRGLTLDAVLRAVWHESEWEYASPNTLYSHTSKLRKRLQRAGIPVTITHPRGLGMALHAVT